MSRFAGLTPLLAPQSIAVVGASSDATRIGGRPIAYMKAQGFQGTLYPINPNRAEIQGIKAYPSVGALPETPDAAIVAVPAELATQAIQDLASRGCKAVVMFTAGFAEMDEAGAEAQKKLVDIAKASGMRLLGPNCLGVFDARRSYYATFSSSFDSGWPVMGRIGIASQSGAYGTHLYTLARNRGIGASLCVMTGNEADVTVGECIGWLAENPDVDVIAVYAEGIRESAGLVAALQAAREARKPIVMQKVGRSELGGKAAQSHTASIAGDDAVTEAVMNEFGVFRAVNSEQMLDIAHTATRKIYPVRNTLGVITVSGGAGVLISDSAEALGLEMPEMPAAAQKRLRELVPFCAPRNPVDATAQVSNDVTLVKTFTESMVRDGGYSSVLGFFSMTASSRRWPAIREQLNQVKAENPDRLYVLSVIVPPEGRAELEADGWVVHEDPTRAVTAIDAMGRFGAAFAAPKPAPAPAVPKVTLPAATPTEAEAKKLLAEAGVPSAPEAACATADEAVAAAERFGFPVVMKILSPDILHKSEIGGVLLDVADADAVREGFALLLDRAKSAAPTARIEGVLVAKQLKGGVECIMGIIRDPVFGPMAMFGLGGIFVEILKDVVFRRCPFGEDVAEQMIRSIRGAPLLQGARGRPPADIKALATMLSRLSAFAAAAGDKLVSIDLNPVFAMPDGQGAFAADAVIEVAE
ncbi:acetate--CoA ligase family protein [Rhodopila sp.]|uniref:acetate--CoA ligase family protein n=1 Tax=Rhodopila sp. TaxID=2480087 RepID=UPI002CA124A7|nr:acetate--CoA ligase family protein [Rhodopila sp.]HVZ08351.1 acetate--CoA ligase family protein [Rhodopila sp.]